MSQEFLTFRNNPGIEGTGRSVFSQQADYRSLDKYQEAIEPGPSPSHFRKKMNNVRSQEKYKQFKDEAMLLSLAD